MRYSPVPADPAGHLSSSYIILGLVLLLCGGTEAIAQFSRLDESTAAEVDQIVTANMQAKGIVGCSVGLMRGGEVAWLKGYGLRDRTEVIPATEHTIYRTGSVAKTFTAILAMQLVEQGKLELQDDVRGYVPEYPEKPQGTITPYRLLCHRSGIRHYEEYDTAAAVYYERDHYYYDPIAALDVFKNGSLLFEPGSAFSYTTFGYNLLGAVIERTGGQSFEQQLRERINRVLDLPYTQAEYQRLRPYPEETRGYHKSNGNVIDTPEDIGILFKVPGGGLLLTAVDMTLLMQGLARYRLFADTATQDWMSIDHSGGNRFGLGIITGMHRGEPYLWHAGGQQRTSTIWLYDPKSLDGVVITSNTFGTASQAFALELLDLLDGEQLQGPRYTHIPHTLEPPVLLMPFDEASITTPEANLSWESVKHGFTYICEYSLDSLFSQTVADSTRLTAIATDHLERGKTWYWRVKALNRFLYEGVESNWSAVRSFETSSTSEIRRPLPAVTVRVYPNPAQDVVHISGDRETRIRSLDIYDVLGRHLLRQEAESASNLTLRLDAGLPALLILHMQTDDGRRAVHRITHHR